MIADLPEPPRFTPILLPVPFVAMAAGAAYEGFAIGPTRHEVRVLGGYWWSRNYYFDPAQTTPQALGDYVQADTWQLRASWGWRATPWATLYLGAVGLAGGPPATGGYDDPLAGGVSAMVGPMLQLSTVDGTAYPTRGFLGRLGAAAGQHWGGASFPFQRGSLDLMHFTPLGPGSTLALRAVAQAATPQLAWLDKFSAGGGAFVRGFAWNRFTGDRLAAATAEVRWMVEPDVLGRLGLKPRLVPLDVGVASVTFVDAGRVWEARMGVPFGSDVRIGGGAGLMALLNGAPIGRAELTFSSEGVFPVFSGGASF